MSPSEQSTIGPAATAAMAALASMELPKEFLAIPVAGAMYLEHMGAPGPTVWWPREVEADEVGKWLARQRSELSLVATSALSLIRLFGRPGRSDRDIDFNVAFLFFAKSFGPTAAAVHLLTHSRCYADAFAVVRALHTRVNLLALFSLAPDLFDEWVRAPKDMRFLDGQVRGELSKHGIYTFPHMYEQASEVVHGQLAGLAEAGHLEPGLFPHVPAIENRLLTSAKFLFGIVGGLGSAVLALRDPRGKDDETKNHEELFSFLFRDVLAPNRVDHLLTSIAEDRHWFSMGKERAIIGQWFSPRVYGQQLALFHRSAQPKRLGKAYRG